MSIGGPKRVATGKSWIKGEEELSGVPSTSRLPPAGDEGEAAAARAGPAQSRWPAPRIAAVEALWGQGFTMPGGGPETVRLAKPLGLSSSVTLLLLGAGLGGPAHAISDGFGAWVASFEADPELRAVAAARRAALDPRNRITIEGWDRAQPQFRGRSANFALSLEALRGARPVPLLESLAGALRPNGQIVLTELVCDAAPSERDREFAAWCRLENRLPELPQTAEVTDALQRLRLDVRVVEDMSDRHITQTLGAWREAVRGMAAGPRPAAQTAAAFVTEAELWLLRIRLMRRLGVRLVRWHAIGGT
jgi:cyclopropane fatty-acyl-phospholipid synthase-like methyltransferase